MGTLTKTGGRKPLAESRVTFGWSNHTDAGPSVLAHVMGPVDDEGSYKNYKLAMSYEEAIKFAIYTTHSIVEDPRSFNDKPMPGAHVLRALADMVEKQQTGEVINVISS